MASTGSTRAVLAHVREPLHRSSSAAWSCSCRLSTASSPAWRLVERGGAGYLALLSKAHNLLVGQLKLAPQIVHTLRLLSGARLGHAGRRAGLVELHTNLLAL